MGEGIEVDAGSRLVRIHVPDCVVECGADVQRIVDLEVAPPTEPAAVVRRHTPQVAGGVCLDLAGALVLSAAGDLQNQVALYILVPAAEPNEEARPVTAHGPGLGDGEFQAVILDIGGHVSVPFQLKGGDLLPDVAGASAAGVEHYMRHWHFSSVT
ncbi:hypothetical protein IU486_28260 [Streptomyces gardneri]|uniref:hypothetical protein n=1 Tax=Nocardia sputi TaxID=2943705 RepID=UPI001895EACF|nr:hypothetical protein [Nocardia sputi]MBF6168612.1 hypothetical protein [Streptomyces gardneri]MBF6208840.1 hypothetical protein [Streptomyces gardneri]